MRGFCIGCLAALILAAPADARAAPHPLAFGWTAYPAARSLTAIASADFNADGRPDVAAVASGEQRLKVLLAQPGGGLVKPRAYRIGAGAEAIAVGDFDGDGRADVATADFAVNRVSVLFGKRDGRLTPERRVRVGDGPLSLAAGDLNRDGRADLAVANIDGGTLSILTGRRNRSFRRRRPIVLGGGIRGVAIADLDRDGRPDLAVANQYRRRLLTLYRARGGAFRAGRPKRTGRGPLAVAAIRLDADRRPDLVTLNRLSSSLSTFRNRGKRRFADAHERGTGRHPTGIAAADMNGDGRPDVVTSDASFGDVTVHPVGGGGLLAGQRFRTGIGAAGVVAADFDGDGKPDLATADAKNGTVSVLSQLAPALGVRLASRHFRAGREPQFLAVADFNGDRVPDVFAFGDSTTLSFGGGHGGLRAPRTVKTGGFVSAAVAGDADGDGKNDLIVADDKEVWTLRGRGDGTFASSPKSPGSFQPYKLVTADMNRDGKLDVLEVRYDDDPDEPPNGVSLLLGRGDGTFEPPREVAGAAASEDAAVADFDGDGLLDVAVRRVRGLAVAYGAADGSFRVEGIGRLAETDGAESELVAADLNGDGAPDLAVATRPNDELRLFIKRGGVAGFEAPRVIPLADGPIVPRAADFNGDGITDLAVALFDVGRLAVLSGEGGGDFTPAQLFDVGAYAGSLSIADFNGDDRPDAAIEDADDNRVWILTDAPR